MKIQKAYILRIDTPLSKEYAKVAADSCDKVGLAWEYHEGFHDIDANDAWNSVGFKRRVHRHNLVNKAQLCTAGHAAIWKKIHDNNECAIILEHDSVMLQSVNNVSIPHDVLIVLGYKMEDISRYNHEAAGLPQKIIGLNGHEGAHAYVLTHKTAGLLINEIETQGIWTAVDNAFFLLGRRTKVPLAIMSPTPAIGWLRESTIWGSSSTKNYQFIPSFLENYK